MINWVTETPIIKAQALKHNLDWAYIAAIRTAENGRAGIDFGVLDGNALTYAEQLEECCTTVAHRLETYPANPLVRVYGANGFSRITYSPSFIRYFASIWAPLDADNDPTGLNSNWFTDAITAYHQFVQTELK